MSESKRLGRQVVADMAIEAGLSKSRQYPAIAALHKKGPPFTYGPHGAEYDPDEVRAWIEAEKAKKGRRY
jgi:hypothetical protein